MSSALADIRVLDLSRVLAGPLATMMLADFGAQVLKVEQPGRGDDTRQWGPPFAEDGTATYFASVNRNKQSIAVDLQHPDGIARVRALAAEADVIVENFRPGWLDELGLGYDAVSAANPRLIYCLLTGFGAGAPQLPGYDLLVQAVGGLMSITGTPEGGPQKAGVAVVDALAGLFATTGILTALHERERSGRGQRDEVNLLLSLLMALVNQASAYTAGAVMPQRMGNRHPSITPYEPLACADGEIVVAVGNDRQFRALVDTLGIPALGEDPRFATNPERVAHRDELIPALEARLRTRPVAAWTRALADARVPAGAVNDVAGAFALAEELGLEPIVAVPRSDGNPVRLTRNPIRLNRTPARYASAPPRLDADAGATWTAPTPEDLHP